MKKTLRIILIFAVVMAACLGAAELVERFVPEEEPQVQEEIVIIANVMEPEAATTIYLDETGGHVSGMGAEGTEEGAKIVYPGTYRISGAMADGQIVVDCDRYHGGVYLMLDNVSLTCGDGPAIYIKQSERTVLYLVEGSVNALGDGAGYVLTEKQEESTGGAVYCDDNLFIEGTGYLSVTGANADGIRSKDGLTISGGVLEITAADDGLQGSDHVEILGGTFVLNADGDGIATKKGDVTMSGGTVTIVSGGDGISAAANVNVLGGSLAVTACGGWENYETMAVNGLSAKGLKGVNVTVTDGALTLNTADDSVSADEYATIHGGVLTVLSGDDALSAGNTLTVSGGAVTVETSYEGMEAPVILVEDGLVVIDADNDGIDAPDSYCQTGGYVTATAPQCLQTEGTFAVNGGWMFLSAREEGCPLFFREGSVTGGTLVVTGMGTTAEFTENGGLPASLIYAFPSSLAAGTPVGIYSASGQALLSFTTAENADMILVASGAMGLGQSYTLGAGDRFLTGTLTEEPSVIR